MKIPYGKQDINQDDINAVIEVLKSDWITQGPAITQFEESIVQYCQAKFAVSANSATSALHIACLALGLSKNDWLWTSPNSFVASANCALYCDANIDFVDIDSNTYNICPIGLEKKLRKSKRLNKLPKILIPVHFAGQSCEMESIYELSQKYGFKIIEDASHAIGGRYKDQPIGNCRYSDITIFSFHPVKIITTAEGGIATTNDKDLNQKMSLFSSHGITRDKSLLKNQDEGAWYYEQIDLGFNFRMTDVLATLGVSQMKRIDEFISKRHVLKKRYDEQLKELPLKLPFQNEDCYSAMHLYPILIDTKNCKKSRREVFEELRKNNVLVNVHYIPIHLQPYYKKLGFKEGDFPNAEYYYNRTISIPMFSSLTFKQQDQVIDLISNIIK